MLSSPFATTYTHFKIPGKSNSLILMFRYFAWIHVTLISAFAPPPSLALSPSLSRPLSLFRKHYALFLPPYFVERDLKKEKKKKN